MFLFGRYLFVFIDSGICLDITSNNLVNQSLQDKTKTTTEQASQMKHNCTHIEEGAGSRVCTNGALGSVLLATLLLTIYVSKPPIKKSSLSMPSALKRSLSWAAQICQLHEHLSIFERCSQRPV
eukprot:TRINITY_DN3416_c0_g2_i1.p1 TRINITY_DN3416_c0_g2~~TRINITY_DN3416_c0_g2_i1.p1  ORF type:complete len:124 (+),score=26.51 TRINITY_DN3416_c0_g2_i1:107-478(+)